RSAPGRSARPCSAGRAVDAPRPSGVALAGPRAPRPDVLLRRRAVHRESPLARPADREPLRGGHPPDRPPSVAHSRQSQNRRSLLLGQAAPRDRDHGARLRRRPAPRLSPGEPVVSRLPRPPESHRPRWRSDRIGSLPRPPLPLLRRRRRADALAPCLARPAGPLRRPPPHLPPPVHPPSSPCPPP